MVLSITEENFKQTVLEADQPVLVNFWAPWCGLCHLLHPFLVKVQKEWQGQFLLVDVNADDNFKLANTYRLKTLPTLILFNHGKIVERIDKFQDRDRLSSQLEQLLQGVVIPNR
ncbi:thioredoxin family protein [[Limnothrix rosea] IAM M-220]|uniref:thioredoxin family protein n=1 Tax=[Limnothrix rosea] IAM M-220 TaxID=454133 RepID=UPI000966152C|nr:thioredoxin domain-containing protein [[Limnothrix rosea] IAM M-220]OKH18936.1 thiol reductase thioredoxin [[Limnothrix rosea] IAM M-220]